MRHCLNFFCPVQINMRDKPQRCGPVLICRQDRVETAARLRLVVRDKADSDTRRHCRDVDLDVAGRQRNHIRARVVIYPRSKWQTAALDI